MTIPEEELAASLRDAIRAAHEGEQRQPPGGCCCGDRIAALEARLEARLDAAVECIANLTEAQQHQNRFDASIAQEVARMSALTTPLGSISEPEDDRLMQCVSCGHFTDAVFARGDCELCA